MDKDMSMQPENLKALFDTRQDPVLAVDDSRRTIVYANPAAAAALGVSAGMSAEEIVPEHILSDPGEQFVASYRMGDARVNVSVSRVDGLTVCSYALPWAEPQAFRPSAASLREMSNSLMNIRLAIDALVGGTKAEDDPALAGVSQTIYREYHRMLRINSHLTMAGGIYQNELPFIPRVVNLGELCRDLCYTLGTIAADWDISIVFKADFGMFLTMADRRLLETMLLNIMTNSLQHCKSGDSICVELTRQSERFVISVKDTGDGIPPEKLAGLFNGAHTDGARGGLFLAQGIAERHGGSLILESRPGVGTSVRVSIPCKQMETLQVNAPMAQYRSEGMALVLTELSMLLDKKYYTRKMFD